MTTILTKKKDTSGAPAPGDLTNAAGGAELAVNTADKRLYTKDSGGNVVEIGTNPTILNIDNIQIDGNTISSTNSNGNINLSANGTGDIVVGSSATNGVVVNSTIKSNLLFTDNTYDIGASGATRPRNLYLAGLLTMGGALTVNGNATLGDAAGDILTINGTAVAMPNNLNFNSNTLFIGTATSRVGVGTASPATMFEVVGGVIQQTNANTNFDIYQIYGSGFPTNEKYWRQQLYTTGVAGTSAIRFQIVDDAYSSASTWLTALRNGNSVVNVAVDAASGIGLNIGTVERFSVGSSVVVNDPSADVDFRVESDINTHCIFVDASESTVNLNYSTGNREPGLLGVTLQIGVVSGASQIFHDGTSANKGAVAGTVGDDYYLYSVTGPGVADERLNIYNGGALVINEQGLDRDFRVESDARSYAFFVDAGSNTIGINNSTPTGDLDVIGTVGVYISQSGSGANQRLLYLKQFNDYGYSFNIDSANTGALKIKAVNAGVESDFIVWDRASAVVGQSNYGYAIFNEGGANADFRVESDNLTHMLWVDASADGINIGDADAVQGQLNVIKNTGSDVASTTSIYITTGNTYGTAPNKKNLDLVFQGYRDGFGTGNGAKARIRAIEQTGNSRLGTLQIATMDTSGDLQNNIELRSAEVVVNEDGIDMDFRVESDTNTNALFVDAGNSKVAINSNTVQAGAALHVYNGGILNYQQFALSGTTLVDIATTITGGLLVIRDDLNGGTCLVLTENGVTPVIVSQTGSNYTTGTPTGTQIKISAGSGKVQASMASGQSTNIRVMVLICDPD